MRRLIAICWAVFAVACSNDAGTNPFLVTDGGTTPDDGSLADMGCGGCTSDGQCFNGDEPQHCGASGTTCVACAAGDVCTEAGTCTAPPACSRDNCSGCCSADGTCIAGTEVDACGVAGQACAACSAGGSCVNGGCREPCGPATCSGCCDATSACVNGGADAVCGNAGANCADCTATGGTCSGGQCVSTACADTCAGCCQGATCVDPPTASQCGASGMACSDCGAGRTCDTAGCVADPAARFNLIVASGEVDATTPAGDSWDGFNGLPDPYVTVTVTDPVDGELSGKTAVQSDTLTPSWDETVLTAVSLDALLGGIQMVYGDDDTAFDDEICVIADITLSATDDAFGGGIIQTTCPSGQIRWRLELAP